MTRIVETSSRVTTLLAGLSWIASIAAAQPSGTFSGTGSMLTARQDHTATLLPNKKVLIVGGVSQILPAGQVVLSSAELFNPSTGSFSATGSMGFQRRAHSATLLPDGRVWIAGGYSGEARVPFSGATATAEL